MHLVSETTEGWTMSCSLDPQRLGCSWCQTPPHVATVGDSEHEGNCRRKEDHLYLPSLGSALQTHPSEFTTGLALALLLDEVITADSRSPVSDHPARFADPLLGSCPSLGPDVHWCKCPRWTPSASFPGIAFEAWGYQVGRDSPGMNTRKECQVRGVIRS